MLFRSRDRDVDEIGLAPGAIHALWTLSNLGLVHEGADIGLLDTVRRALEHPSAGVRMNAVRVLPRDEATLVAIDRARIPADPSALVRLALLETLSECAPGDLAGDLVLRLLRDRRTLEDPVLAEIGRAHV